ncbi:MAG: GNAT family N-acetyltransferase [Burkholderiales bacterium]
MPDLLVKLYELDRYREACAAPAGVTVRRGMAHEKSQAVRWVGTHFGAQWADETSVCFARQPVTCFLAVCRGYLEGFACHDATLRGFFGPIGVAAEARRRGVGRALAWAALDGLRAAGYGYAIIGSAGELDFYVRCCGAIEIPGSVPGVYAPKLSDAT